MKEKEIGKIVHYYDKIKVGIIELTSTLNVGDTIRIGSEEDGFTQTVNSMQVEHEQVETAKAKKSVGVEVDQEVKKGSVVYLVS